MDRISEYKIDIEIFDELGISIENFAGYKPSVFCLFEIWLTEQIEKSLFVLKDYSPKFYRNGNSKNERVGIDTLRSLKFQQINFSHNTLNLVAVKCTNVMKVS